MSPGNRVNAPKYNKGEKIFCDHKGDHYEAKVLDVVQGEKTEYCVHYKGWKSKWDEWVDDTRILKYTPENIKRVQAEWVAKKEAVAQSKSKGKKSLIGGKTGTPSSTPAFEKSGSASRSSSRTSTPTPAPTPPASVVNVPVSVTVPRTTPAEVSQSPNRKKARRSGKGPSDSARKSESEASVIGTSSPAGIPAAAGDVAGASPGNAVTPSSLRSRLSGAKAESGAKTKADSAGEEETAGKTEVKRGGKGANKESKTAKGPSDQNQTMVSKEELKVEPEPVLDEPVDVYWESLPFSVPEEVRRIFFEDREMCKKNYIPLIPAPRSVKEILRIFCERSGGENSAFGTEKQFVMGFEAIFNDFLPNALLTEKEIEVKGDKEYSECYGVVHLIRILCYLSQIIQLCMPTGSGCVALKNLCESLFSFLGTNAEEFLSGSEVKFKRVDSMGG